KNRERIVLTGYFYISIQHLSDKVIEAEKETKERAAKKGKPKDKNIMKKAEIEEDNREEAIDDSESKAKDCKIVDIS
ncbi:hypothetical protein BGZ60DRAFT_387709, partial [Tricladium varicosporioides]